MKPTTTNQPIPIRRRRGAPKGNLNALKHGHSSPVMRALARELLGRPEIRYRENAEAFIAGRLGDIVREDVEARKQAEEHCRRIMEPFTQTRLADRLAARLLIALVQEKADAAR